MNIYPFAAIVGQDALKHALLVCAVDPSIGGILICGDKGSAKTTAVRGLAALLPPPARLVNLPLGASEDRVLGSLDLAEALKGQATLKAGLLAAAHLGVLYIDEVNLLADHLVDVLLDAAASGVLTLERDGFTATQATRFTLIGTMNPEEGALRPQFLDRFGLMLDVAAPQDVAQRSEVVRRRLAFEQDRAAFVAEWQHATTALQNEITAAQARLPHVHLPEALFTAISQLCCAQGVRSLRGDLVLHKTARALCALAGRDTVTAADVHQAAQWTLPHRSPSQRPPSADTLNTLCPPEETEPPEQPEPPADAPSESPAPSNPAPETTDTPEAATPEPPPEPPHASEAPEPDQPTAPPASSEARAPIAVPQLFTPDAVDSLHRGRRAEAAANQGRRVGVEAWQADRGGIAVAESLRAAMLRQPHAPHLAAEDLRVRRHRAPRGGLLVVIVDTSGSMAVAQRIALVQSALQQWIEHAQHQRDTVAVIECRGAAAEIRVPPTQDWADVQRQLAILKTGGRTPLASALQLAAQLIHRHADQPPCLLLLSDGRANVGLTDDERDPWTQTLEQASALHDIPAVVVDTEQGPLRLGRARPLATALAAQYLTLDALGNTPQLSVRAHATTEFFSGHSS